MVVDLFGKRAKADYQRLTDPKEAEVLASCQAYLKAHGYLHWRNHIGGIQRSKAGQKLSWSKNPNKGMPDLFVVLKARRGHLVGVEVKTRRGLVSDMQRLWATLLVDHGCSFAVVRSLSDLIQAISEFETQACGK